MSINCRQCGSNEIVNHGPITQADMFCGLRLNPAWKGGNLYRCNTCLLAFRFPIRSSDDYLSLYKVAPEITYQDITLRHDQSLVRDAILRIKPTGCSILDIGCSGGALLTSLGKDFDKYGIEASEAACAVCQELNINIVGNSSEELGSVARKFDVICLVDVIEHLINPLDLIEVAIGKLNDGGYLILSTGDASNLMWRLAGGRYWYCSFPEHISFISPEWVQNIAKITPLSVVELQHFPHKNQSIGWAEARIRFLSRLAVAFFESIYLKMFAGRERSPRYKLGFPGVFNDHMLVMLKLKP
jgi:SAM-dependent methyltransferase